MTLLVCFSGQIGSGKSSVSQAVSTALGWRSSGFGDYLRLELARQGKDPSSRAALQELGERLVDADVEAFYSSVLANGGFKPGDNYVLDGIRHEKVFQNLKRLARPSVARLIFLRADPQTRLARVALREDREDFDRATNHRVEAEALERLPMFADAIIDATRPFSEVVEACRSKIDIWLFQSERSGHET